MIHGTIYAHSLEGRPMSDWQPLDVHLRNVANVASEFAQQFYSADWAWNAGLLHDIGKAADAFQAYLRRENHIDDSKYDGVGSGRVNHSSAGAALAEENFNQAHALWGRILSYLIAGHHAGLPDYYPSDGGMGALQTRLKEGRSNLAEIREIANSLAAAQRPLRRLPNLVKKENFHFWVRMLFSCLVDADFLDTEAFMQPQQSQQRAKHVSLNELKNLLDQHMARVLEQVEDTPVNRLRREILLACRSAASLEPGLFTLTVPTGGDKTLSGMSFALDHAVHHGKQRVIYVIPYTSIIEQTAAILSSIFGSENVVEHHSNLDPERETLRTQLASENWDAPIVLTTNVQFFESLFAARPSRCRKLHNLVNSVVILDEAQLVPPNFLAPCVAAINELTSNYEVTLVLATATQPALPKLRNPTEIVPHGLDLYERLKRSKIVVPNGTDEPISWEGLAAQLRQHEQVLCIVNIRCDCIALQKLLPAGTICLSALMCGEHRSRKITMIKERLANGDSLRVVSTQLVEAGVDIDFLSAAVKKCSGHNNQQLVRAGGSQLPSPLAQVWYFLYLSGPIPSWSVIAKLCSRSD